MLLYTIAGFFILPPIIRSVAAKQISQQLGRETSIEQVKLNPYALSVAVRGLLIKDKDGEPFVSWDEVYVNFQISSLFSKTWSFKEISLVKPYARVQMNPDRSFNFSDILQKFATNAPASEPKKPSAPLLLHIEKLHIAGAAAALTDLTMRHPFKRMVGPLDITLENFRTTPDNRNPYAFTGTTDAGERFSWNGHFYLDPLRSEGELTLDNISLNKYAPLYQDFVKFEIRDGSIGVFARYNFELGDSNHVLTVTNAAFALRNLKVGMPDESNNIVELSHLGVSGVSADLETRHAEVDNISANGGRLAVRRNADNSVNLIAAAQPAPTDEAPSAGILLLLRSVTNAVTLLLQSTNQWSGMIHNVDINGFALHAEDFVNSRPATLDLDDIAFNAKNISNLSGTNLAADLSLRWNTNGFIKIDTTASFLPPTADVQLTFSNLNFGTLDPYLESKLNFLILNSQLGLDGIVRLRTPSNDLPQVTFQGDVRLDDLRTVDGAMGENLLTWNSLRVSGIHANLQPQTVDIKEIAIDDAYARVIIETNRTINLLTALSPAQTNATVETNTVAKTKTVTATNTASALPQITVGNIVISNATLQFTDRSLSPGVNLSIQQAGGTISGISSTELQRADVSLHALVDNVGPADITGHINPFSGTQTNDIKISVHDVDLTPTSPYAGKYAGYRIARGKLNLDLNYFLVGRKLSSQNVITLDQFTFGEKVNSPDATKLPVRLGIAILKDREGKIVLDVPVEGSLDDPQFRVSKVVMRAIVNILTKVATSPFSLLGAAFGGGGEELSYQDFAPGAATLTDADKQKLDSLVKGLYERPGLNLEIIGSIEPASDRDGLQRLALDQQLRARKWQSLRKSDRASVTPDQITLKPDERAALIKKLYSEALADGKITPALIAGNTNLAAAAAQVKANRPRTDKGAIQQLAKNQSTGTSATNSVTPTTISSLPPIADPMEALLTATFPVSDDDLEKLAAARATAIRDYLLATGKVEAQRLFLAETGENGVRKDGSRAYLQFQ